MPFSDLRKLFILIDFIMKNEDLLKLGKEFCLFLINSLSIKLSFFFSTFAYLLIGDFLKLIFIWEVGVGW